MTFLDNETKEDKLNHYSTRNLKRFTQYDGWYMPEGGDDIMRPDAYGHCMTGGLTNELMTGLYDVRVLVSEGADKEQVVALLLKLAAWIQTDGYPMEFPELDIPKLDFSPNVEITINTDVPF